MLNKYVVLCVEKELLHIIPAEELTEKRILVGLSGGADSVTLLISLCALSEKHGFSVAACHINHMIRGDEATRDENFAKELCKKFDVPFYCEHFNVPEIAKKQKKGLEEAARNVRYNCFQKLCDKGLADYVATAHNASDNAETVILNITRGCGISGICGIPKRRSKIIRPLLSVPRKDIESFLAEIGQPYVTDSTNLCDDCTRNIIRHKVIPELCSVNPSLHTAIAKLSEIALRENEFLENAAVQNFTDNIDKLAALSKTLQARIIGNMCRELTGNMPEAKHLDRICEEIKKAANSNSGELKIFNLSGGISIKFECGKISAGYTDDFQNKTSEEYDVELSYGINEVLSGKILAIMCEKSENNEKFCKKIEYNKNIYSLFMEAKLFSDIIKGKIRLRSGCSGDKIKTSGISKDVKKVYSSKKIALCERKILPRIYDSKTREIIALPYVGVCDSQREYANFSDISVKLYKLCNKE